MGTTQTEPAPESATVPSGRALASTRAFVACHGSADGERAVRGVVENIGRCGAKVVLVGVDGRIGDVLVPSVAVGERLVEAVSGVEPADWGGETTAAAAIGPQRRRSMAGPRGRR